MVVERRSSSVHIERALDGICYESPGYRYARGIGGERAVEADGEFEHVVGVLEDLSAGDHDHGWAVA